jgi:FkbM family methyltransferase
LDVNDQSIMCSFRRTFIRESIAGMVSKRFPSLSYFWADKASRLGLSVDPQTNWIDIVDERGRRAVRISRSHSIYLVHMINCFDYYFGSAEPIRVRRRGTPFMVVDFSTPRFQRVVGFDDFHVLCPSSTEPFAIAQQYIDLAHLEPGDIVFDLGSYSGLTSIAFSKAVGPAGQVIAVEPDPLNYSASQTNLALHSRINKLDNVALLNAAVSSNKGFMRFSSEGTMGSAAASIVGGRRGDLTDVECLSLQDLADMRRLSRVDFVKMDIEGLELPVLGTSETFFRKFRPRIVVEPHMVGGVFSEPVIRRILESYGYECSTIPQTGVSLLLVTGAFKG